MRSLWLSLFDYHDVSEEDIRSYQASIDEDHLEATTFSDGRTFQWNCCGAPGRMGIPHRCEPPAQPDPAKGE